MTQNPDTSLLWQIKKNDKIRRLRDGSWVGADKLTDVCTKFRELTKQSEASADALGAIIDLVAYSALPSTWAVDADEYFRPASKAVLYAAGLWGVDEETVRLIKNAVELERDRGVYVWRNPLYQLPDETPAD